MPKRSRSVARFFFFFFQAEDGIRDHCVTGVQTCALPICGPSSRSIRAMTYGAFAANVGVGARCTTLKVWRSEERRVGKECRSGRWPALEKKKRKYRASEWLSATTWRVASARGSDDGRATG